MSSQPETNLQTVSLHYGADGRFSCQLEPERLLAFRSAPPPLADLPGTLTGVLNDSLEFPPLRRSAFPGDRIVLAVDREVPETDLLIAGMWTELAAAGVTPEDVLILQPAGREDTPLSDPRVSLPDDVRARIAWRIHDTSVDDSCRYLASSATGERLYLAREIVEADVVMTVGRIGFDSVLGYSGTNSVFYPGLSNTEAVQKAIGQGHRELGPDDDRPLRQMIDEIGWLLGTQYSLQVLPSVGGGVATVLAGSADAVFRQGKRLLAEQGMLRLSTRCDVVVAAVDGCEKGDGWHMIGAALETARNIVARGGKILILSDSADEIGEGMQMVRDSLEAADALQPLRTAAPPDLRPATQVASAAAWADIYLLSNMDAAVVEELFMTPLANEREARRLLQGAQSCVLVESAQYTAARVNRS